MIRKAHSFFKFSSQSISVNKPLIVVGLICGILSFKLFAQLPNLGTASNFAVFTSIGALDNAGISTITGDVGTDLGAISGFGLPTIVNGTVESANSVTAQCAVDVLAAYNELAAVTPTVLGHTPVFGNGETLVAGVYFIGGAGSIAATLTLDAEGNPNAIFIFQFGGQFTSAASSIVNLINGASACNVFWIADGAMAMAASTEMKGTLVSNNGAISLGAGGILEGRMLTTNGAAYVYDVNITTPDCIFLPINLISFEGECLSDELTLNWQTASELNNDFFTIERSETGHSWEFYGDVLSNGNSSAPQSYSFQSTQSLNEFAYYRLKQTDVDGNFSYISTIAMNACTEHKSPAFEIHPNPSEGLFLLSYEGNSATVTGIEVYTIQGELIERHLGFLSTLNLVNQQKGIYFICIIQSNERTILRLELLN